MRLLSNLENLDRHLDPAWGIEHRLIAPGGFWAGFRIFRQSFRFDVLLINCNVSYLWLVCFLRFFAPLQKCRLILLDGCFIKPVSFHQKIRAWFHRLLLTRVDRFLNYFKDLRAYEKYYGISPERSIYVPFKVNGFENLAPRSELSADGDYIFTGGRSLRDLPTFVEALRLVPYPGVLLYHDPADMRINGTDLILDGLPPNLKAQEDDGSLESWIDYLRRARVVVVTTLPDGIRALGISTYLQAMGLRKCVVITESTATADILSDQAMLVPPSDPPALARAIREVWENDPLRTEIADRGRDYAETLGDEQAFLGRIIEACRQVVSRDAVAERVDAARAPLPRRG